MNLFFPIVIFLFSFSEKENKIQKEELFGKHWAGGCKTSDCDTMEFTAFKKYDSGRYQWGGCGEGMEFYKDGTSQTYHNVMCSSESSPAAFPSTWKLQNDTLTIDGYYITVKYKVISISKKEMKLLELGFTEKKPE